MSWWTTMAEGLVIFCGMMAATVAEAQRDYGEDGEFRLGSRKRKESNGPTIGGMPAWALAMLATIAACAVFAIAFCLVRSLVRKFKGQSRPRRRIDSTPASSEAKSVSVGGDAFQCHLCLARVGRRKWESGSHRAQCARANAAVLDRLPIPYGVTCARCGALLRQWPRRGPQFRCGGGRGCPASMGGRPLVLDNNGANRFACFECNYDLCRACVQRRLRRQELQQLEAQHGGSVASVKTRDAEPDLLQVREPSLRRLRLEFSDVSGDTAGQSDRHRRDQPDVVGGQLPASPRILVTAPTNQDLLDQVIQQKRRQHQPPPSGRNAGGDGYGAAAAASRASSVVAMSPSLVLRTSPTRSRDDAGESASEHPSLMSSELSSQTFSNATSPTPLLQASENQEVKIAQSQNDDDTAEYATIRQ